MGGRGRRQETNICLLSGASPKESTAGYKSTVLSLLLATQLLSKLSWAGFGTHACTLLTHTNYLISKSAHTSLRAPCSKRHSKESKPQECNNSSLQNRPCCLLNCQRPLKNLMEKGSMTRIHHPREGRKELLFLVISTVCLVN